MLVVLEGADATGKTTIAEDLSERYGFSVYHSGPPSDDAFTEYMTALLTYTPGIGQNVVLDRLHWGEMVYGPLYRGKSQLTMSRFLAIEATVHALGGVVVLAKGDNHQILERAKSLKEDFIDLDLAHIADLQARFHNLANMNLKALRPDILTHDFDSGAAVDIDNELIPLAHFLELGATS